MILEAGIKRIDNFSIIDKMLHMAEGECDLVIGSFAVVESWLKRMLQHKKSGKVKRLELVINHTILTRHREMIFFIENIADGLLMTETHAKFIYLKAKNTEIIAVMSANATANYRIESYVLTDNKEIVKDIKEHIKNLYHGSNHI